MDVGHSPARPCTAGARKVRAIRVLCAGQVFLSSIASTLYNAAFALPAHVERAACPASKPHTPAALPASRQPCTCRMADTSPPLCSMTSTLPQMADSEIPARCGGVGERGGRHGVDQPPRPPGGTGGPALFPRAQAGGAGHGRAWTRRCWRAPYAMSSQKRLRQKVPSS